MAIPAVSVALSKFNDALSETQCGADEHVEELVTELTWMQCFLVDGEKTAQGRVRTDIWSSAIERLAVCAQELNYGGGGGHSNKSRDFANLNARFASLRAKIQPFLTCQAPSSDSANTTPAPDFGSGIQIPKEILVGAWGGPGGSKWDFKPKGLIKQITIIHGTVIDSITFTGVSADGRVEAPIKLGGPGGSKTIQVNINGPSEYLRGVSGTYGNYHGLTVLRSIKFETNVTTRGPHGTNDGTPFSFAVQDGKIVGFHGRAGDYVDAIGVYVTSI
ncbi:PREDICTED: jacalin-related lectin 19-like isoform X1 [Ipomoea nil]|uniref:jacalin-related lectin 19-like isoform X1 n=1 Tax=Ipomoea nil TaxID=35883 RepID=UPI0009016DB1|nr:PREDICTED: jacalin-related lectin 19-like isoform X1 [Ipomoea nil]